ncbi:hypothetical protein K1719_028212 [Acacia pycnantha]|nr:hypothetical protein K1719_042313 [Acacia pycnantha]KAI9091401.1 hypothetical protein K1719_028212 [Acacia pycnantha]
MWVVENGRQALNAGIRIRFEKRWGSCTGKGRRFSRGPSRLGRLRIHVQKPQTITIQMVLKRKGLKMNECYRGPISRRCKSSRRFGASDLTQKIGDDSNCGITRRSFFSVKDAVATCKQRRGQGP